MRIPEVVQATEDPGAIVGVPVIMTDGRYLCYSCFQDCEGGELECWMPGDEANYPCQCDGCGLTLLHESQRAFTRPVA